jgi:hypothetical protein
MDMVIFENWFVSKQKVLDMRYKFKFEGNLFTRPQIKFSDASEKPKGSEEFINFDLITTGPVSTRINDKYTIDENTIILNSTFIEPPKKDLKTKPFAKIYANCTLMESSELILNNIHCFQEAKIPLGNNGRVGTVTKIELANLNFTGILIETIHDTGVIIFIYGTYIDQTHGNFNVKNRIDIKDPMAWDIDETLSLLDTVSISTFGFYAKCYKSKRTCGFYALSVGLKQGQPALVAYDLFSYDLDSLPLTKGKDIKKMFTSKASNTMYILLKDKETGRNELVSLKTDMKFSINLNSVDLPIPIAKDSFFEFCASYQPVIYKYVTDSVTKSREYEIYVLSNEEESVWTKLNFNIFGLSKIDKMTCSGTQILVQSGDNLQIFSIKDFAALEINRLKSTVNIMNTLKLNTKIDNLKDLDFTLIGISSEFPNRRIRSENSTLLFWDAPRKNFNYLTTFNNPTVLFKKLKEQDQFKIG